MLPSDEILTKFTANSTSFGNLYSSHDSKCDYAKRPFRTFDANAKEKDYESGFHYYGSRYYSGEISTWLSTDPMADKYPSLTPYNYCANNPVKLIDPNGDSIKFAKECSSKFIANYNQTKDYLISKDAGSILNEIESSLDVIYLKETSKSSFYNVEEKTIYWNPFEAIMTDEKIYDENDVFIGFVIISPATVLNHEADHANLDIKDHSKLINNGKERDTNYGNKEERRVIGGAEQDTAKKLGEIQDNQVTRKNHNGTPILVKSSISTENALEIK